jgi:hypothetical protein
MLQLAHQMAGIQQQMLANEQRMGAMMEATERTAALLAQMVDRLQTNRPRDDFASHALRENTGRHRGTSEVPPESEMFPSDTGVRRETSPTPPFSADHAREESGFRVVTAVNKQLIPFVHANRVPTPTSVANPIGGSQSMVPHYAFSEAAIACAAAGAGIVTDKVQFQVSRGGVDSFGNRHMIRQSWQCSPPKVGKEKK